MKRLIKVILIVLALFIGVMIYKMYTFLYAKSEVNIEVLKSKTMSHQLWDDDLVKFVNAEGLVDYKNWQSNQDNLKAYLQQLSKNPPAENWSKNEKLAYWINAYNANTVQLILNHYPISSIKDILKGPEIPFVNTVWSSKNIPVGNKILSLDQIEHHILIAKFKVPQIHFAINCASISCPRLRNHAYTADSLEYQLNDQENIFVNNQSLNTIELNHIEISKIFDWFAQDFGSQKELLERLSKIKRISLDQDVSIAFKPYNWKLNESVDQYR